MLRNGSGGRVLIGSFGSGFPKAETARRKLVMVCWGVSAAGFCSRGGDGHAAVAAYQTAGEGFCRADVSASVWSIRVMEKCGLVYAGPGFEEGTVLYREQV